MPDVDEFDDFYKSTRTSLLQQTYALTADLPASRSAVRDAYVAAWHHWRKVSRLDEREAWVRRRAWGYAQRRHSARILHRDRNLDPEIGATLAALSKLPLMQRKVLLLTHLSDASMVDTAREVGLPLHEAEARLQSATAQFAINREVSTVAIRPLLDRVREDVGDARWPRVTIVRRAGTARRRTHTVVGAVAVVATLVLGGAFVTDAQGIRPSLENARSNGVAALRLSPGGSTTPSGTASPDASATPTAPVATEDLVTLADVSKQIPGRWREVSTDAGKTGIVMPCQSTRFADPEGTSSAVRRFKAPARKGQPKRSMVQSAEMSATSKAARTSYATMLGWFGGCSDARVQLISTHAVNRVGDDAKLLVLRSWKRPASTLVAGVARTGLANTITFSRTGGTGHPDLQGAATVLAAAVNGLCRLPDTGPCAEKPKVADSAPVATGDVPAMLSELDLPPVAGVDRPWIGTEARVAHNNLAASRCDATSFDTKPMKRQMTRSFVIPEARLSNLFGLTETVGQLPEKQAHAFVSGVRTKLRACPDNELGTDVVRVADSSTKDRELTVWHVTTEISDNKSVTYLMGILRDGGSVAQVGFVPDGKVQMAPGAFITLAWRALDRLPELARKA